MSLISQIGFIDGQCQNFDTNLTFDSGNINSSFHLSEGISFGDEQNKPIFYQLFQDIRNHPRCLPFKFIKYIIFDGLGWGSRLIFRNKKYIENQTELTVKIKVLDYLKLKYLTEEEESLKTYENLIKVLSWGVIFGSIVYLKN